MKENNSNSFLKYVYTILPVFFVGWLLFFFTHTETSQESIYPKKDSTKIINPEELEKENKENLQKSENVVVYTFNPKIVKNKGISGIMIYKNFSDLFSDSVLYFNNCNFYSKNFIYNKKSTAKIDFTKCYMKEKFGFFSGKEKNRFYFHNCAFKGINMFDSGLEYLDIESSQVENKILLGNNVFQDVSLTNSYFKSVAFTNCTLNSNVDFFKSTFDGLLQFTNMKLNDQTQFDFQECILPDTLNFSSNGKIYNDIDFTVANFKSIYHNDSINNKYKPHYIYLYKSDISKIHLDYTHFKLLKKSPYKQSSHNVPKEDMYGTYEALLNNFKARGQQDSYELLDIEYKDYRWENSKTPWMSEVERLWWNYGYDKQLIFKWAGIFLLVFSLITFLFLPYFNSVYKLQKLSKPDYLFFENMTLKTFFIRWWFAFVYSSALFFGLTLKIENIEYKKFWGTIYIVLMYTLGIVCLAYMANFVIQK